MPLFCAVSLAAAIGASVDSALRQTEEESWQGLNLIVFFQAPLPDVATRTAADAMASQNPDVVSMTYTSSQQAYDKAALDPLLSRSLLLLKDNPLPASASLKLSRSAWLRASDVSDRWQQGTGVQEVRWDAEKRARWQELYAWRHRVERGLAAVAALTIFWALRGVLAFSRTLSGWREALGVLGVGLVCGAGCEAGWRMFLGHATWNTLPLWMGALVSMGTWAKERR